MRRRRTKAASPWGLSLALCLLLTPLAASGQQRTYDLRPLERVRNPLVGRADLAGRVFEDLDENGRHDAGEPGIAGVMIRLGDGRFVITDATGRYQFSELSPGQQSVAITRGSLPTGVARAPAPRLIELPPGSVRTLDFPLVIKMEALQVGQPEVRGQALFLALEELPVNVVGNATDLQALVNGARLAFPAVDVELSGFSRGGFVDAAEPRGAAFQPSTTSRETPGRWTLAVRDSEARVVLETSGEGQPPRKIDFEGKDSAGAALPAPAGYTVQLCLSYAGDERSCSPWRPFGLTTGKGRKMQRPALDVPPGDALAEVNGQAATLDKDGSFISPVRLGAEARTIRVRLRRADGRESSASIEVPAFVVESPGAETRITWGSEEPPLIAPERPADGDLEVHLKLGVKGARRAQVGNDDLKLKDGVADHVMKVGNKERRLELSAIGEGQVSTLYELRAWWSDTRPDGRAIIDQPAIPQLYCELPIETSVLNSPFLRIRGHTEPGNRLQAGAKAITVGSDGRFDTLVEIAEGDLLLEVTNPEGTVGTIKRSWPVESSSLTPGATLELAPFGRALYSPTPGVSPELRKGLQATGSGYGIYSLQSGLRLWGGAGVQTEDRPLPAEGEPGLAWGRADARLGAEGGLGKHLGFALGYQGAFFLGGDAGLPMRHAVDGAFGLESQAFDALLDAGLLQGARDDSSSFTLVGGGLGVRFRATEGLDLRARVGGRVSAAGGEGEVLDGALQATFRSRGGLLASLRYAHVEDNRDVEPEAAGDVVHLSLGLPLGQKLQLSATLGAWLVSGAMTLFQASRLELLPTSSFLFALDFRLQSQPELTEYLGRAELSYQPRPWLRLGLVYAYVAVTGGVEHSSRLQLRLQVVY
ncbi:MAG: SdrD B-like domain-containing protein [Deltaproteobacteria bacterium]|nr:SdrD B-like domain-containing protein [Deltaproteobacteria bacterium]